MKIVLYMFAMVIVLTPFSIYDMDHDIYLLKQEQLKHVADDCSAAALLYYDEDFFSGGYKVFNKTAGNDAVEYLIGNNLSNVPEEYYTYYFDGDGTMTTYRGRQLLGSQKDIDYPYIFTEGLTGYKSIVEEPRVIVTINNGLFDYRLTFMKDQPLIRTSGYEYVGG